MRFLELIVRRVGGNRFAKGLRAERLKICGELEDEIRDLSAEYAREYAREAARGMYRAGLRASDEMWLVLLKGNLRQKQFDKIYKKYMSAQVRDGRDGAVV